jgi:GNAT superfamily N-acetyltransferase
MVCGYPAKAIRLHRPLSSRGLRPEDVHLDRWNPVATRRKTTVLMSHRRTGEAAGLMIRFGRGRVIAVGGTQCLNAVPLLSRTLVELAAAGRPARSRTGTPRHEILPAYRTRRLGPLRIRYPEFLEGRAGAFLKIARKVLPFVEPLLKAKKPRTFHVELTESATSGIRQSWVESRVLYVGMGAADGEAASALAGLLVGDVGWSMPGGPPLLDSPVGWNALGSFVGLEAMRAAGFVARAARLGDQLEPLSRRLSAGRDLGWAYSEDGPRTGFWVWCELARQFGPNILHRCVKAAPAKPDWSAVPEVYFTATDKAIYFLSRAVRRDLYPWFASIGMTVRPLPMIPLKSKRFKPTVKRMLQSVVGDPSQPASERTDAAEALAQIYAGEKRPLAHAARQSRAARPAVRLVGALRLSRVRDPRATPALWSVARDGADASLAAVAALLLVEQGERKAGGVLADLAESADVRFQLDAGYQLGRIGHAGAQRFSFEGIRRAVGPKATGMLVRHPGQAQYFPTVNGEPVANIFGDEHVAYMPHATPVSMFYVQWVHTWRKFRRKGLSKRTMAAIFDDHRMRRCSCAALDTGTRNTAHFMYRSFGFVDVAVYHEVSCELPARISRPRAKGVRVRPYRPGDEGAMVKLFNACYEGKWAYVPPRPRRLGPDKAAVLARRGGRLVAFAVASVTGERANALQLAVAESKDPKRRQGVAAALIGRLHSELERRGVKNIHLYCGEHHLGTLLGPLGYRCRPTGGVVMFAMRDLPRYLEELKPLLQRRLEKAGWTGTISLLSPTHKAALTIDGPRVTVHRQPPKRADITLAGSDRAITRIAGGIATPFEEYLQLDLKITPMLNARTRELLETLLPKLQEHYWLW